MKYLTAVEFLEKRLTQVEKTSSGKYPLSLEQAVELMEDYSHFCVQYTLHTISEAEISVEEINKAAVMTAKDIKTLFKLNITKDTKLEDTNLSVRIWNILRVYQSELGIERDRFYSTIKVGDLSNVSMSKFLKCRNAGKRSLQEIIDLCSTAGIKLKP